MVQGMGFVTAIYHGLTPVIESSTLFQSFTRVLVDSKSGFAKYKIVLKDGQTVGYEDVMLWKWLLYARGTASQGALELNILSNSRIRANASFIGTIQVAKNPCDDAVAESTYDSAAGSYATGASVSGYTSYASGTYSLKWTKAGVSSVPLLMFALPHHLQSFDATTNQRKSSIQLQTTTKGLATAILSDSWVMNEPDLPVSMGFAPWNPIFKNEPNYSASAIQVIAIAATSEVSQDMSGQTNLNSMYFSGKALSKFATIVYTIHDIMKDSALANAGLTRLKDAFAVFAENRQKYPLVYESAWKGIVSTAAYVTGEWGADFGNAYYNDHHFHWGYFIHAAAIIGYLDPSWLDANRDWVNTLIRDGLYESADGKDEESSSEDALFAYATKMWGKTSGDKSMEARGNVMLSILSRSLQNYFLLESSNQNQPSKFIANKVTGIVRGFRIIRLTLATRFNTFRGMSILSYMLFLKKWRRAHDVRIHMIPINPSSALTRTRNFVREEWEKYFDNGRVDRIDDGFKGILYANLAIADPASAWKFFSQNNFQSHWLDGGASRAWYLAYAAGVVISMNA
ncbi:hypothetical protein GP486_000626 [Trichoglossum hirsutum]|uniref:glucan endo-1,3-beta-D-glucosidase n=1 Tax=Trichoglossum hirsutum TaxID=265104 RepID=A0A9P8RTD7_9PEZI|nr:hypothetical protein GP486_000626 [Trichoglossum hirsutum]